MKRVLSLLLILVVVCSIASVALASEAEVLSVFGARFSSSTSCTGGTVFGDVLASQLPGETVRIYVYLQVKTASGSWKTKATAYGQGSKTVTASCTAISGNSYRVKYTYEWYDSAKNLLESGYGYSNVIQVP